jgi:hypothetical protein
MLVLEQPSCPLGHHVHVTVLAAAKTKVGDTFSAPHFVGVCVCVCVVMYYQKRIVLALFVNCLTTLMGTFCSTYVSNIKGTVLHSVDLKKSQ